MDAFRSLIEQLSQPQFSLADHLPGNVLNVIPKNWHSLSVFQLAVLLPLGVFVSNFVWTQLKRLRVRWYLRSVQSAPGHVPLLGHAMKLMQGTPWDLMHEWVDAADEKFVKLDIAGQMAIVMTDPKRLRQVLNTKLRNYPKDIELSYKTFMDLLGTGLVTSEGLLWKKQRQLLSHALRIDILEETAPVAKRAVDRLSVKLEAIRGTGKTIELAEEFRVMTLQVIGELILSLTPEESEEVFPDLYLPIVEEANRRVWAPYRTYLPTPGKRAVLRMTSARAIDQGAPFTCFLVEKHRAFLATISTSP
eukprot:TRINITY_DN11426_c0_g1_i2.p2 TRINITY_DN11426_c0_g1~~TRINITY_DN11426_c0_g1_i2.p2  ORF type:complete len:305 (+),score=36.83 TRINITY_DN11426_c0_g1_i2:2184-3098(+)